MSGTVDRAHREEFDVLSCLETLAAKDPDRCTVAPSPDLSDKIRGEVERLKGQKRIRELTAELNIPMPKSPGLNDGLIIPGSYFPLGTSVDRVRSAAADRSPLHGTLQVVVVLVDFADQVMAETNAHFEELFFSTGVLPNGSVREYFDEVTNGLVTITGQVVGPYRMPQNMSAYANGASGTGTAAPNARTMAKDAATAANADVNYAIYDNDGNGFVDAFIVVHAGAGAEQTGSTDDIWSHKWVLAGGEFAVDATKIYAYLTVPEDARIGVCAHELGHLLFGFPDLYDTDNTSEGIGNWCLMAGGSWLGDGVAGAEAGDIPGHPSAWCKAQQAWVTVQNVTSNQNATIQDVKDSHTVYRLWKDGGTGQEYFLLENRQRTRYDEDLPGEGLLIWHIDDAITGNTNESHYRVALEQADGALQMENNVNRGDPGDPWPGSTDNRAFNNTSTPNSKSYGGISTCVAVTSISDPGPTMTAYLQVKCGKTGVKDVKDRKDGIKERVKEWPEHKRLWKERIVDKAVQWEKPRIEKRPEKPDIDKRFAYDKGFVEKGEEEKGRSEKLGEGGWDWRVESAGEPNIAELEARIAALEAQMGGGYGDAMPFIDEDLRPDLRGSAMMDEPDGGIVALDDKRSYDVKPPEG